MSRIHSVQPWLRPARPVLLVALVALAVLAAPVIAHAQQLTLSWLDNSGGQAGFILQRATGSAGAYAQIAQLPAGTQSYSDTTVSLGTTYCYRIAAVNSSGVSPFSNIACGNPSGGFTVTAVKGGTGLGTVTSSPAGITCGTTCASTFLAGNAVTLTAAPSSGSGFTGWSGGGCGGTAPCTIAGNGPVTVTATFSTAAAVAVSSVTPNRGTAGATVPVTITGSGFAAGPTVSLSGAGVTVSNVSVGSATQLTATLTIATGAALGARDVTVTNAGGAASPLTGGFTVVAPTPSTMTLAYNGLLRDRVGQGNTALGPDGALDGTLTATLSAIGGRTVTGVRLDSNAPGLWDTDDGNFYWVLGVAPTLDGALLNAPGTTAVNFPVANGGSFVLFAADYQNAEFLPGRTLTLTATFSDGSTATASTTVPASVTITSVTPNQGTPGAAVPVTITGSGFAAGATVSLSGTGVTVSNVSVGSATQLTATLTIASGAALGARDVTVTNAGGGASTLTGGFTVVAPTPATLTLAYNGLLRDRVGQGVTALGPDGALDGTLTATLSATGGRTVTALRLDSNAPGIWDTDNGNVYWVLGVAPTLDGALLNASGSMAVNFPVANGGSFVLFAADYQNAEFLPGRTLTLTATLSDGTTATASTTVVAPGPATLALAYNGLLRDRVGQGDTALGSDGALDGTLTATLSASGGRAVTALRLDSTGPGTWDTTGGNFWWVLGVAASLDGALLNAPGTMAVNFPVANGGSFVLFASDYQDAEFLRGRSLTLTATFADGSTATATITVP